jgi:hemerythrin-like domain-containing protein
MKRAEALQPLSRDHLKALLAAKRVREAPDVATATSAFSQFWDVEQHHFRIEEEVLLPHWAASTEVEQAAVERMLADHLAIRRDALRLERGGLSLDGLRALGTRLHDHVRFEERELFPLIEQALDDDALAQLGAALAVAHR